MPLGLCDTATLMCMVIGSYISDYILYDYKITVVIILSDTYTSVIIRYNYQTHTHWIGPWSRIRVNIVSLPQLDSV